MSLRLLVTHIQVEWRSYCEVKVALEGDLRKGALKRLVVVYNHISH